GYLRSQFTTFINYREGCALICLDPSSGELLGYVCGTQDVARHYRVWLRRNFYRVLPWLLVRLGDKEAVMGLVRRGLRLLQIVRSRGVTPPSADIGEQP